VRSLNLLIMNSTPHVYLYIVVLFQHHRNKLKLPAHTLRLWQIISCVCVKFIGLSDRMYREDTNKLILMFFRPCIIV